MSAEEYIGKVEGDKIAASILNTQPQNIHAWLGRPLDYQLAYGNVCIPAWDADGNHFHIDLKNGGLLKCRDT